MHVMSELVETALPCDVHHASVGVTAVPSIASIRAWASRPGTGDAVKEGEGSDLGGSQTSCHLRMGA